MKFDIDIDRYEGEDLILMTGAPGCKWSHIHMKLLLNTQINRTECKDNTSWSRKIKSVDGDIISVGSHRGAYWGPGNAAGEEFFNITTMSKRDIVEEFMKPFDNWDKLKVIKSHWFSYNLEYLAGLFPKAKILNCYANDIDCFYVWHKVGGWGIVHPNYSWYENDTNLLNRIKEENYNILKFCIDRDIPLEKLRVSDLYEKLGLQDERLDDPKLKLIDNGNPFLIAKMGVYSGEYDSGFSHTGRSQTNK